MLARKIHICGRIWAKIYKTTDPHNCKWEELSEFHRELYLAEVDFLLEYMSEQGVVLKVGEISDNIAQTTSQPETYYADKVGMSWERTYHVFKAFKEAGYVAVESLIEEE